METKLWYLLLIGSWGQERKALANFYAYGSHLGTALHHVLASASVLGLTGCELLEATALDKGTLPDPHLITRLAKGVYVRKGLHTFKASLSTAPFLYPLGVVRKMKDGVLELSGEKNCFVHEEEVGCFSLQMRLQRDIFEQFLYRVLQSVSEVCSIQLTLREGSGSGAKKEKWVHNSLGNAGIPGFLQVSSKSVLWNGFVDLAVLAKGGTLRLEVDEQKHLNIITHHMEDYQLFLQLANDYGVEEVNELPDVELCHFRLHQSFGKLQLHNFLQAYGFKKEYNTFLSPIMRYILFENF